MTTIQIQKDIKIGFEELIKGFTQMDTSSLERFSDEINKIIAQRKAPEPSQRELELINIIYQPLDEKVQVKYDSLVAKNINETITEEEYTELLNLVEIAEQHNVDWLTALVELANLRGVSIEVVKEELGVKNPNFSK